jgi:general secretion pathway protein F
VRLKVPVGEVRTAVNEGSAFADALSKHPKIFDELYVSMVRAGEVAGNLDEVLERLADFLDGAQKLKSKVQSAMIYPLIMLIVGAVIMAVLMVAVIPEVTKMFSSQGKTLPWNTRLLIWGADTLRDTSSSSSSAGAWASGASGAGSRARAVARCGTASCSRSRWSATWRARSNVARFSRTLSTMLRSGVPMLRALDTAKEILGNVVLKKAIDDAKQAVTEGESLAVTLKRSGQFPR